MLHWAQGGEAKQGTKHFRAGAKVYVIDAFWGTCDSVTVIGQHRSSRRFICDEIIILDDATIEKSWGWVFFQTSKKWHETNDIEYAIAGNAPIIVEKDTGKLFFTGTAYPMEHYIQNYEKSGDPHD